MRIGMEKKNNLFLIMFKIGLFTFGGGYAMIALLENEFVSRRNWLNKEEFIDIVAIAESTPGPIAINAATYIGYRLEGIFGSVKATLGVCTPSFAIIYVISLFLDRFLENAYVAAAFKGIQVCVIYLIFMAGIRLYKGLEKTVFNRLMFTVVLAVMLAASFFSFNFSTIAMIIISGLVGIVVNYLGVLIRKEKKDDLS